MKVKQETTNLPVPQSFWGAGLYGMTIRVPYFPSYLESKKLKRRIVIKYYFPLTGLWYTKSNLEIRLKTFGLTFTDYECIWILRLSLSKIGSLEWADKMIETYYNDKLFCTKLLIKRHLLENPYGNIDYSTWISRIDLINMYYDSRQGSAIIINYDFSLVPEYIRTADKFSLIYDEPQLTVKSGKTSGIYTTRYKKFIEERKDIGTLRGAKSRLKMYDGKEEFVKKAREIHGNKFNYDNVNYINKETKVEIVCNECGRVFQMTPSNHVHGKQGCPFCAASTIESKGEYYVRTYLETNNIKYRSRTSIYCDDKHRIIPDFIIVDNNVWIEYNGRQHYEVVDIFHKSIDNFKNQLERDIRVRNYCKEHNIILIEIPYVVYTKNDVDTFLNSIFCNLTTDSIKDININYSKLYKLDNTGFKIEDLFPT